MKTPDPLHPSRADYRLIRKMLDTFYAGRVQHVESEYARVVRVFAQAGGSWGKVFLGSVEDLNLLKKVLKVAYRTGALSRATRWK